MAPARPTRLMAVGTAVALALGTTACEADNDEEPVPTENPVIDPGEEDPILDDDSLLDDETDADQ